MDELFLNNLKYYYELIKKTNNQDIILPNSFIFSTDMKNFKILNSISEIFKEDLQLSLLLNYYKKVFLSYYEKCPDLSNVFLILTYEILESLKDASKRYVVGRELEINKNFILNLLREKLEEKVKLVFILGV